MRTVSRLKFLGLVIGSALMMLIPVAWGKRQPPPDPIAFTHGESVFTTSNDECGIVIQTDRKSGERILKIVFYRVTYQKDRETDVQDIWITDFFRWENSAWARDEAGRLYRMPLDSLDPIEVKDLNETEFDALKRKATGD